MDRSERPPHSERIKWFHSYMGSKFVQDRRLLSNLAQLGMVMRRLIGVLAMAAGVGGCVAAQPYDGGAGYYRPRSTIGVGIGGGSFGGGGFGGVGAGVGF